MKLDLQSVSFDIAYSECPAYNIALLQVTHFHHSSPATRALQEAQGVQKPLNLVQDVTTRWNSQLAMVERLLKLRVPLYNVLHNKDIVKPADRKQYELPESTWKVSWATQ